MSELQTETAAADAPVLTLVEVAEALRSLTVPEPTLHREPWQAAPQQL